MRGLWPAAVHDTDGAGLQHQVDSAEGSSRTEQQAPSDCQSTHRGRHSSAGLASPDLDMRERGIVVSTTKFVHVD